jgi:hypothetical protein
VPESHYFNHNGVVLYAIVKVIANPTQMDAAYARETYVRRGASDIRLCGQELECALNRFAKRLRSGSPVQIPPGGSFTDLPSGTRVDPQGKT